MRYSGVSARPKRRIGLQLREHRQSPASRVWPAEGSPTPPAPRPRSQLPESSPRRAYPYAAMIAPHDTGRIQLAHTLALGCDQISGVHASGRKLHPSGALLTARNCTRPLLTSFRPLVERRRHHLRLYHLPTNLNGNLGVQRRNTPPAHRPAQCSSSETAPAIRS